MIYEDLFPSFSLFPRTGSTLFPQISYSLQYIDVHKKKIIRNKQQFVFLRRWTVFCLPPFLIAGDKSVSLRAEGVQAFVRPLLLYLERNDKE